jgi:hypothetical protein
MSGPGSASPEAFPAPAMAIMVGIMVVWLVLFVAARRSRGRVLLYLASWLVLAVLVATLMGSFNLRRYRAFVATGARADGVVIALTPENHNTVQYRYAVGGRGYEGQQTPWTPNPPTEELHIGQKVVVVYDPASPGTSVLGDPEPMLANETDTIVLGATVMPTVIVLSVCFGQWRARRKGA